MNIDTIKDAVNFLNSFVKRTKETLRPNDIHRLRMVRERIIDLYKINYNEVL